MLSTTITASPVAVAVAAHPVTHVVEVDLIVPVHNSEVTLYETLASALSQRAVYKENIVVHVCCYDDGSTDNSWKILQEIQRKHQQQKQNQTQSATSNTHNSSSIETHVHIAQSRDGISRGAGFARNRAVHLRPRIINNNNDKHTNNRDNHQYYHQFLCFLDSDDLMEPTRVAEQVHYMLSLSSSSFPSSSSSPEDVDEMERCLLGCQFRREPIDSTRHYTDWANSLSQERLGLERYREVTVVQPTWMMCRSRFDHLGGYLEAPHPHGGGSSSNSSGGGDDNSSSRDNSNNTISTINKSSSGAGSTNTVWRLVHPSGESPVTLRLAEDLRLFHAHLAANGILRRLDHQPPLVVYRHHHPSAAATDTNAAGGASQQSSSQSSRTSRKLLLQLRARAFEQTVLVDCTKWKRFIVWGAGRDGKDFCKALSPENRDRVYCLVDVDDAKIRRGFYFNTNDKNNPRLPSTKIPIVHFSYLIRDPATRERLVRSWQQQHEQQQGLIKDDDGDNGGGGDTDDLAAHVFFGRIDKRSNSTNHQACTVSSLSDDNDINNQSNTIPATATTTMIGATEKKRKLDCSKNNQNNIGKSNRQKHHQSFSSSYSLVDLDLLPQLPVVVCVAMYRTNGALENNVKLIGRTEGEDLWHFS